VNDREWNRVVALLAENWPHQLQPESALAKYRRDLEGFPASQVIVAIETFYRDGREFPPNGGHVVRRLSDLHTDPPDWFEACKHIRRALRKTSDLIVEDDSEKGWHYHDERIAYLDREAPLVAVFVRRIGMDAIVLNDGGDEARLRNKYEDFVARSKERLVYGGLPTAGLARLERVKDGELVEGRAGELPPRAIPLEGGGVRRIAQGPEQPRKVGFDVIAGAGRKAA
jgi:hypothetical protein